jgi:dienelactone hydrolase
MKKHLLYLVIAGLCLNSCNNNEEEKKTTDTEVKPEGSVSPALKEETVNYSADGTTMNGFVVYDENRQGARPVVLVVPEWWGVNDFTKTKARQLAELGYIAMTVDLYGNGKIADNPDSAMAFASPFYKDPQKAKTRFDAALAKLKPYSQADTTRMAAIGFCFGGTQVLNIAKLGENLKGVVCFHGGLEGAPVDKNLLKAEILVLNGGADTYVSADQVSKFKKQMDSIGAKYTFKNYEGATHAFSNPDATENGKKFNMPIGYNAAADSASWNEMKAFLGRIF